MIHNTSLTVVEIKHYLGYTKDNNLSIQIKDKVQVHKKLKTFVKDFRLFCIHQIIPMFKFSNNFEKEQKITSLKSNNTHK